MARTSSAAEAKADDTATETTEPTGEQTAPEPEQAPAEPTAPEFGTGQEPNTLGIHQPGKAPGEYADLGPVTLPADAPRSS